MDRKIIIIAILLPLLAGAYFVFGSESYFAPHPYINTVFASSFNWEGYNKIEIGMSRSEVKNLIGPRISDGGFLRGKAFFSISKSERDEYKYCDAYTDDKHIWGAWIQINVCFDGDSEDAKVIKKYEPVINN